MSAPAFLLDSDAVTFLVRDPDVARRAIDADTSRQVRLLSTMVVSRQKENIGDNDASHRADCIEFVRALEPVATTGFIIGASLLDFDYLADAAQTDPFQTRGRGKDSAAVLGATAKAEGATLVTGDLALAKKARGEGVDALPPDALITRIKEMTDGEG